MKTGNRFAYISALFAIAIGASACGSGGDMLVNVKSLSAGTSAAMSRVLQNPLEIGMMGAAGDFGAAAVGTTGLSSYKLYIQQIQICEGLTVTNGSTAYNGPSGCSEIYANDDDNYDTFGVTEAAAAGTGKYFDMLSASDRASLTQSTSVSTGDYNYGVINWYKPVKMTAAVSMANGSDTLYTKACASNDSSGSCVVTGMDTGPAAESIVQLNNGGTWFKFLKTFTVASGDEVELDLAFDLEKKVFAGDSVSNGGVIQATGCGAFTSGYCGMFVPMLKVVPVPRKAGENTMVETYEMTPAASSKWKMRVDVYYNSADTTKTVLAADVYPIPTAATDNNVVANVTLQSVTETATQTSLKNYLGDDTLVFTRGTSGTGTFTCLSTELDGCTGAGSTITMSWSTSDFTLRTL